MAILSIAGTVVHQNATPIPNVFVVVTEQKLRTRPELGQTTTLENGQFSLTIQNIGDRSAFYVEVRDAVGKILASQGPFSVIGRRGELRFVVEDSALKGAPVFKARESILQRYAEEWKQGGSEKPVNTDDARFIAAQTGLGLSETWRWMKAQELETQTISGSKKIPAEALYGLLNQGLPANITTLSALSTEELKAALQHAIDTNQISGDLSPETFVAQWNELMIARTLAINSESTDASLGQILTIAGINNSQQKKLLELLATHQGDNDQFWAQAKAAIPGAGKVEKARTAVQLAAFTGMQSGLLTALLKETYPAGVHPIAVLAARDAKDWETYITTASTPAVPAIPTFITGANVAERKKVYAERLEKIAERAFPTHAFFGKLSKLNNNSGGFAASRTDLQTFFSKNPDFDLKKTTFQALASGSGLNLSGIANPQNLLKELRVASRLAFAGSFKAMQQLYTAGLDSARAVAAMPRKSFLTRHSAAFDDPEQARQAHKTAEKRSMQAFAVWSALHPNLNQETAATNHNDASLLTLFGSLEAADCEHCLSVYSPAAYLTDILHFLESRSDLAYAELVRRRPDLTGLLLNCENTNTPLPYVDLVIELLENTVKPAPTGQLPRVYQTTATAAELAANPEHINLNAYELLKNAVYPVSLPFQRELEESRTYLNHLGLPRHQLMSIFFAGKETVAFDDAAIAMEYLGFSPQEKDILTGAKTGAGGANSGPWNFFGFDKAIGFQGINDPLGAPISSGDWVSVLSGRVDIFLQQTGLSYTELLVLLACRFINPKTGNAPNISIVAHPTAEADTVQLNLLKLNGLVETDLIRIHRFVRLQRKLKCSFQDLDKIFKTFGITGLAGTTPKPIGSYLTSDELKRVSQAIQLQRKLGGTIEEVLALWGDIGTDAYPDYEASPATVSVSLYEKLFRNKATINPINEAFKADTSALSGSMDPHMADLQAVLLLSPADLSLLKAKTNGDLSLPNLSVIYRHAKLAEWLNLSVRELLTFIALSGVDPFSRIAETYTFAWKLAFMRGSGFSSDELDYLLRDRYTETSGLAPDRDGAISFMKDLQAMSAPDSSAVEQKFSAHFGLNQQITHLLLSEKLTSIFNTANKIAEDFTFESPDELESRMPAYRKFAKAAFFIRRLKIEYKELERLMQSHAVTGCLNFDALPIAPSTAANWSGFEGLINLINARNLLIFSPEGIFETIAPALTASPSTAEQKRQWMLKLIRMSNWDATKLEALIGTHTTLSNGGVFKAKFPEDFQNGDLILRIQNALEASQTLGLNISDITVATGPGISSLTAQTIKQAVKAKYDEPQWYAVAKPLRDELRERQRAALVDYLVHTHHTDRPQRWQDSTELYEYLLIDVEMKPVAITSRLKQAICSVQLFIDRALMNLEFGTDKAPVLLDPEQAEEWKTWRKIYRVWEANRKIFLYPENWIEPELRDDQTPFFREATSLLLQNELNPETVEDAFRSYLEKLDEVARLEIVGMVHQQEPEEADQPAIDVLHVFGRTIAQPHQYFYRTYEKNEWLPWQKIELDIDSDHLVPVIFNRRLCLFWLFFTQQAKNETIDQSQTSPTTKMYWKIQVAWSEFRKNTWTGKKLSKSYVNAQVTDDKSRLEELRKGLFVRHYFEKDSFGGSRLFIHLTPAINSGFPTPNNSHQAAFVFENTASEPLVKPDILSAFFSLVLPRNAEFKNEQIQSSAPSLTLNYELISGNKIMPGPSERVLNGIINGPFRLVVESGAAQPFESSFVFQDSKHCFFVKPSSPLKTNVDGLASDLPDIAVLEKNTEQSWGKEMRLALGTLQNRSEAENPPVTDAEQDTEFADSQSNTTRLPSTPIDITLVQELSNLALTKAQAYPPRSNTSGRMRHRFQFTTFYHPHVKTFFRELNKAGVPGVLRRSVQQTEDQIGFAQAYQPTTAVTTDHPRGVVDFAYGGPYAQYNWELFFHLPIHIACRLSADQRFDEARKWFHYVFDPTAGEDGGKERFWQFLPFHQHAALEVTMLEKLLQNPEELDEQLEKWAANPFQPHAVARLRIVAYMKFTVMKYIDNLIAWGDQLFRRDTIESINEATNLYVLAAKILGPAPQRIPARAIRADKAYKDIHAQLDQFSNVLVDIEQLLDVTPAEATSNAENVNALGSMFYFGVPRNEYLLQYWQTVADRLFKIRHSLNIDGLARTLPLFEPPIDPALLVRAAAAGMDLTSILNDSQAGVPLYRFAVMLQKANELTNEVKGLGASLLSVLEKKDAEALSLLRSGHEQHLLKVIKQVREQQVEEAKENLNGLNALKRATEERRDYFGSKEYKNASEKAYANLTQTSHAVQVLLDGNSALASLVHLIPETKIGSAFTIGTTYGGINLGNAAMAALEGGRALASALRTAGEMANIKAIFQRRDEEWKFQTQMAELDLKQISKQITASEIRLDIANRELSNHRLQMEQSAETDEFMRSKFTNKQLYDWMSGQLSSLYFQSYQLAYDFSKKAEKAFQFELGLKDSSPSFIQFGYWDSLKKGLLTGEKLQYDLRRLEMAYLEQNKREFELTKHISLAQVAPQQLLALKNSGTCSITLPEALFDQDFDNHELRRVKSISLSIPCIAGPYTSINATLRLVRSNKPGTEVIEVLPQGKNAIATSSAQNDSGLFELNFRDERYLPFEGAGLENSEWSIEMPKANNQFDFETITDVIMHLRYTARESDQVSNRAAKSRAVAKTPEDSFLLVNLRQEYSTEWYRFLNTEGEQALQVDLKHRLPFMLRDKMVKVSALAVFCLSANKTEKYLVIAEPLSAEPLQLNRLDSETEVYHTAFTELNLSQSLGALKLKISKSNSQRIEPDELKEMFIILTLTP